MGAAKHGLQERRRPAEKGHGCIGLGNTPTVGLVSVRDTECSTKLVRRRHLLDSQPEVAEQALAFTRNLIAEASDVEITQLFEGVGEEALFESIESAMSGINRTNMSSDGDGAVGRPDCAAQDSQLQASDRLEQVSLALDLIGLF